MSYQIAGIFQYIWIYISMDLQIPQNGIPENAKTVFNCIIDFFYPIYDIYKSFTDSASDWTT